jgi:AcrR family transcriptional regulator
VDGDTRQTIRDVALDLFSTKGFEQTSLREIAERVGLTKASLYHHYASKQDLLLSIVEPLITGWRGIAENAEKLAHSRDNVGLVLGQCLDVMLGNQAIARIFLRDPAGLVAAAGSVWQDLVDLSQRLNRWLAGPDASTARRLRAVAAFEVISAALGASIYVGEVPHHEMRTVLLDAAMAVLDRS